VLEIIAAPNRRAILSLLVSSQRSVAEIERQLGMPQPIVSKRLRVPREAGLVESTVDAQRRLYRLRPEPLQEVDTWLDQFRRFWSAHVHALECPARPHGAINTNEKEEKEERRRRDNDRSRAGHAEGGQRGALVRKDGEKWTPVLVRELRHSPQKASQALTDPVRPHQWASFDSDGSMGTVGTARLTWAPNWPPKAAQNL